MAIAPFTKKILCGETLTLFGDGSTSRDYTYVSDIVDGIFAAMTRAPATAGEFGIYNLGGEQPVTLKELVAQLEIATGKKALIQFGPMQSGDVERTFADISKARRELGYEPKVSLSAGLARTVEWVRRNPELT